MSNTKDCDCPGCVSVGIIVLIVLWLTGYFDKPKEGAPIPQTQGAKP